MNQPTRVNTELRAVNCAQHPPKAVPFLPVDLSSLREVRAEGSVIIGHKLYVGEAVDFDEDDRDQQRRIRREQQKGENNP